MENPYQKALTTPFLRLEDFFVKKETVIGINGKMQGKRSENNPAPSPIRKIRSKLSFTVSSPHGITGLLTSIVGIRILEPADTPPSRDTENLNPSW